MIGQYLDQLDELAERLDAPVITGDTTVDERERLFEAFRAGEVQTLVVSQGGQLLDRPARGHRGDPGLRLVRLPAGGGPAPRPAAAAQGDGRAARFYALVARDTVDQDFAANRQRFLAEQGYAYRIMDAKDVGRNPSAP